MEIVIKERIAQRMRADLAEVQIFFAHADKGWSSDSDKVVADIVLDLSKLTANEVERLHDALSTSKILGTKVLAADIKKYLRAGIDGIDGMTARTVRQAAWLIEHTIAGLPHHLLFSPDEYGGGSYVGYFVNDVDFTEEKHGRNGYEPPECSFTLVWIENDVRRSRTEILKTEDVVGLGPEEILRRKGLVLETPALMERLRDETERYYQVREQIGKKYVARGIGLVDLDDAAQGKRSRVYRGHESTFQLDLFGMTTPVVVDVLGETDEVDEHRTNQPSVNVYRWHAWNLRFFSPSEDDLVRHLEATRSAERGQHLRRHAPRLRRRTPPPLGPRREATAEAGLLRGEAQPEPHHHPRRPGVRPPVQAHRQLEKALLRLLSTQQNQQRANA